ncbi:E3 ubiquitin-protein ligase TRIM11-like isoform X2 [Pseudophryne corroboree]
MASAVLRQELDCSICLSSYIDPVTLRCGHNFCRDCIDRMLDAQEVAGVYSCPECRAVFPDRPALEKRRKLCNIAEHDYSIPEEGTGVFCTYCVQSPVPALKSCLKCETSLCDTHWRTHNKSAEHVLVDPTISLEKRKCSVHKEILKYFCTEDSVCICASCTVAGEHQGHKVESLDEASEKKKEKLRDVLQRLITKRAEAEIRVQSLQERRREDQGKAAGVTETVTALFRDIRRQLEDLEKRVLSEISRQEQRVSLSLSDLIQKLEIQKDELSGKMRHIEELCNMSDPVTVLQEPDTGDVCDTEDTERHDSQVRGAGDLDVGLISGTLHTLSDIITGINTGIYVQEATDILLDVATAANNESDVMININTGILFFDENTVNKFLRLSDDRKIVFSSETPQDYPETPERFGCYQVISTRGFSSGRHYWDVNIIRSGDWRVGMCYPSIDRRGDHSDIGYNNRSWCFSMSRIFRYEKFKKNVFSVIHGRRKIELDDDVHWRRVLICLDYEGGQLSFYAFKSSREDDTIDHLHTFKARFTEPLHAALYIDAGHIKITG